MLQDAAVTHAEIGTQIAASLSPNDSALPSSKHAPTQAQITASSASSKGFKDANEGYTSGRSKPNSPTSPRSALSIACQQTRRSALLSGSDRSGQYRDVFVTLYVGRLPISRASAANGNTSTMTPSKFLAAAGHRHETFVQLQGYPRISDRERRTCAVLLHAPSVRLLSLW